MKHTLPSALATALLYTAALSIAPAHAQSRVFVAAQGSDINPCTFGAPCRTFQHAHDVVAANGEIDVLDPADYGIVTISKAISIQGRGFSGIAAPSGDAITISASSTDKVNLRGLLIDGVSTGGNGITFNSGGALNIQDSLIRNFRSNGINFAPSASSKLSLSNTLLADNTLSGVLIRPTGSGSVTGVLDHTNMGNNATNGLRVDGSNSTGTITVAVSDSVSENNVFQGIAAISNLAARTAIMVRNSTIANNGGIGLEANGSTATLRATRSTITGNGTGLLAANTGQLVSFGDNSLAGNTTDGAPTSTIPLR